jgi:hypothetical protein
VKLSVPVTPPTVIAVSEGVQYSNPHTSRVDAALVSRRSNSRIEAR